MSRKFSRRARVNSKLQFAQIVGLVLALVMLLMFKDRIAGNAGAFLDAFGPPPQDLKVPDDTVMIADPKADMGNDAAAQADAAPADEAQPAKNSDK